MLYHWGRVSPDGVTLKNRNTAKATRDQETAPIIRLRDENSFGDSLAVLVIGVGFKRF
jgi:hypothetical protein